VMADGFVGQMIEPLDLDVTPVEAPEKLWAVKGNAETRKNLITSIYLEPDELEAHQQKLEAKYRVAQQSEARYELYLADDAEILYVGYGIVSRVLRSVVEQARARGIRAGLFRPITLWPYASGALRAAAKDCQVVQVVELSNGQMVEDVRLALGDSVPVELYTRTGGNVPSAEEIMAKTLSRFLVHAHR
jgi:pyruvate/2-oxoacid:ferredoxin oxidoreductase alpha subunit